MTLVLYDDPGCYGDQKIPVQEIPEKNRNKRFSNFPRGCIQKQICRLNKEVNQTVDANKKQKHK